MRLGTFVHNTYVQRFIITVLIITVVVSHNAEVSVEDLLNDASVEGIDDARSVAILWHVIMLFV